jgi:putative transposase
MENSVKKYESKFKAKVVLELLKEELTLNEVASKYQVAPQNISRWKKEFLDNVEVVFNKEKLSDVYKYKIKEQAHTIENLYQQIGELSAQLNWAKKKSSDVGIAL